MNIRHLRLAVIAAAGALGACGGDVLTLNEPDTFGMAVRHNVEAQVVDPDPKPQAGPIPMDGSRAAIAMQRYQTDRVKQPRSLRTTEISIFSGPGNGGGGTGGQ